MPIVSVVIPAFEASGFIFGALASALGQTVQSVEVIVVDDASRDGAALAQAVATFADPRLRLIRMPANGGAGAARNAGFALARGEFVAVLDADDSFAPDRLARLIASAEDCRADLVADDLLVIEDGGARRMLGWGEPRTVDLARFALGNRAFTATRRHLGYLKPLFRRSFLEAHGLRYLEGLRIGEDYAIVAEALAFGARFVVAPFAGYRYAVRPGSVSRGDPRRNIYAPMLLADAAFRQRHAERLGPAERVALDARRASLEDASAFTEFAAALRRRRFEEAAAHAWRRPAALRHLALPIASRLRRAAAA